MGDFVRICSKAELPPEGHAAEITVGDRTVCIANVNGTVSAMDNVCIHRGGPLGQGIIENGKLVCPWHGWQFDPSTGQAVHNAAARVALYPLKIEGEDVFAQLD